MRSTGRTGTSVLERAFSLLEVVGSDGASVGLAELARRAELPKATRAGESSQTAGAGELCLEQHQLRHGTQEAPSHRSGKCLLRPALIMSLRSVTGPDPRRRASSRLCML